MTTIAWLFLIPGIASLVYPIYFLLFKKQVLSVQWLFSASSALIGIALILYSGYYNDNIRGEYFYNLFYCAVALLCAPVHYLYVSKLTNPNGASVRVRLSFIPPFVVIMLILISALMAGREECRLLLERAIYGNDPGFTTSVSYNFFLFSSYYLFLLVLVGEIIVVAVLSYRHYIRFYKVLDAYMVSNGRANLYKTNIGVISIICTLLILFALILGFGSAHSDVSVWIIGAISIGASVIMLLLGFVASKITLTAEDLVRLQDLNDTRKGNLQWMGTAERLAYYHDIDDRMVDWIERHEGYLDRKICAAEVMKRLGVTPTELANVLHLLHGSSFDEYIDGLRINRAISMILLQTEDDDSQMLRYKIQNTDFLDRIAEENAFESAFIFKKTFDRVMGLSIMEWISEGISK